MYFICILYVFYIQMHTFIDTQMYILDSILPKKIKF